MVSCHFCGFAHEGFQPTCSACGAPLRADQSVTSGKTETESVTEKIRRVCRQNILMYKISFFVDGDSIPEKKIRTIMKSFTIFPNGRQIFFYCDTTPLNNGKQGFMICEDGIYWQNNWYTHTNRNFLPWDKFKERSGVVLRKYDLDLGAGDVISMAGLGRKAVMSVVEGIFQRIHKILNNKSI
jgi:predicted nucleic acid-binding Zn ribbon protein